MNDRCNCITSFGYDRVELTGNTDRRHEMNSRHHGRRESKPLSSNDNATRQFSAARPKTPLNKLVQKEVEARSQRAAIGQREDSSYFKLFGGTRGGQILLLDHRNSGKQEILHQAHSAEITELFADTAMMKLISSAKDKQIKIWKVQLLEISDKLAAPSCHLKHIQTISLQDMPLRMLVMHNSIVVGTTQNTLVHCKLNTDTSIILTHSPDDEHTDQISKLAFLPTFSLVASSSTDGTVKLWDSENVLIREIQLNEPVSSVCFANARGDLFVGLKDSVYLIKGVHCKRFNLPSL